MKIAEFKLRIIRSLNALVDDYFSGPMINEKFINTTLKLLIKQNSNKYDKYLEMFADETGEIDAHTVIESYAGMIDEKGLEFDLKKYIDNVYINSIIPNKVLIIKKEDIVNMLI